MLSAKLREVFSTFYSHIGRYRPSEHRDLTLYSYFSSDLEYRMTLTSVTPYTVPWKDVAIHVCHKTVEKTQILYSINGSLVALCQADLKHVCINVCGHTRVTKLRSQCTEN